MKKFFLGLALVFALASIQPAQAQLFGFGKKKEKEKKKEESQVKLFPGMNFSFRLGDPFRLFLYPNLQVKLDKRFGLVLTGQYQYHSENFVSTLGEAKIRNHYGGANLAFNIDFGKFIRFRLRGEGEAMYGSFFNYDTLESSKEWEFNPLIGGGIFVPLFKGWGPQLLIVGNLNFNDAQSLYSSPLQVRLGFTH